MRKNSVCLSVGYVASFLSMAALGSCTKPAVKSEPTASRDSTKSTSDKSAETGAALQFFNPKDFASLYEKEGKPREEITIGVIDSGYGGLSVLADIAAKMKKQHSFKRVNFVFYNAFFSREISYGDLSREDKPRVLSEVLTALAKNEKPDVILLACNTLSVFYYDTAYAKAPLVPTIEIVEPGTRIMEASLKADANANVIFFGTPVTVGYKKYPQNLAALGFPDKRVIPVSCGKLAGTIEAGMDREKTRTVIAECVSRGMDMARAKNVREKPFVVSLNCTHFLYAQSVFEEIFSSPKNGIAFKGVVTPNTTMSDPLFLPQYAGREAGETEVRVAIKSPLPISNNQREGLGRLVAAVSPETYEAMKTPLIDDDLYDWQSVVDGITK